METPLHAKLRRGICKQLGVMLKVAHEQGKELDDIDRIQFVPVDGGPIRDIQIVFKLRHVPSGINRLRIDGQLGSVKDVGDTNDG